MRRASAIWPEPQGPDDTVDDPCVVGTHSVVRTGAPPIRLTGQRIYHCRRGTGSTEQFISLWTMRSAGLLLAHSLPDKGARARTARRTLGVTDATERLEAYCSGLQRIEAVHAAGGGYWDDALEAMIFNTRIEAFCTLVGSALAEWHDRHDLGVVAATA
ncbi:MAG: hypothetical protein AAFW64_00095 [Pseudomonadota bacterium]